MGGLSPAGVIGGGTIIGQITFSTLSLYGTNQTGIFFANTAGSGACIRNTASQQFGLHVGSGYNRVVVVAEGALYNKNYDHALQTNPLVAVHSATDPDTDNTQYVALQHDQTHGHLRCGKGSVLLDADTAAPADGAMADGELAIWFNGTGDLLTFKYKDAGVTKSGTVALT